MRLIWLLAVCVSLATAARGQDARIQPSVVPPIQQQWQQEGSPPVQRAPVVPEAPEKGSEAQDQAPSAPPPASVQRPNDWLPAGLAKLQALDKVDALASPLMVKVGQSTKFGSLTITVRACMVRPSDQAADAAAYLDVTDSHPGAPGFSGWMLEDEPSVSMMQHPVYDLRVTGCA